MAEEPKGQICLDQRHGLVDRRRSGERDLGGVAAVAVTLEVQGQPTADALTDALQNLDGVFEVAATDLAQHVE
jgi:hypothetical protein